MSRGPAVIATALALALVNIGLATLIVALIGAQTIAPTWVGLVLVVVGLASAVGAVIMWRQYLAEARQP